MSERKSKKKTGARQAGNGASGPFATGHGGPMDVALLQQIVKLMATNDLSTVDLRDGGRRIVLKRGADVVAVPAAGIGSIPQSQLMTAPHPSLSSPSQQPVTPADDDTKGLLPIKSPMVGTFYAASKPGEKPFVSVGTPVNEDTDVCIIEAMKTFNVHKAGLSGTIARVLVQDGQTVQFDQPLFLVKP